jgi:NHL repeat
MAFGADGSLFYANPNELGRIDLGSGEVQRSPVEVSAPHALAVAADGRLLVSDSGNNRIIAVEPTTWAVTTIAGGLRSPLGMALEADGDPLVVEYGAGRLTRVRLQGSTETVASGLRKPYALAVVADGVYVVEAGELRTPSGTLKHVLPDGTVRAVALHLG